MAAGDYTAKLVEQDGTVVRTLVDANVYSITEELNGIGSCRLGVPKVDPAGASGQAADLLPLDREIQVFRHNGTTNVLVWWGPIVQVEASAGSAEIVLDVPGLGWYFTRRQISDARDNRLDNPNFASGTTDWTNVGGSTHSASTANSALGGTSLELSQASDGEDTFDYQQQTFTAGSIGTLWTVRAWVYIVDADWIGPALGSRGLFVSGIQGATVRTYSVAEIDDSTPRDELVPLEVQIWVPPLETWTLEVRLYAPGGTVRWSAVQLVKMESLFFPDGTDIADIGVSVAEFINDTTHGWSDLGWLTSAGTTGVETSLALQYADHQDSWTVLNSLVEMGMDWWFAFTTTTKTFTTGAKGTDRTASVTLSMRDAGTGNLSDYRLSVDGSQTTTRITVLGDGDGPDREEGYATDASDLGGLVLGDVINAPSGTPINALQHIADSHLADSQHLVRILEVIGVPGDATQHGTLVVGDRVASGVDDGWVETSGSDWRIVRKTRDCVTDTCSFVLNEVF